MGFISVSTAVTLVIWLVERWIRANPDHWLARRLQASVGVNPRHGQRHSNFRFKVAFHGVLWGAAFTLLTVMLIRIDAQYGLRFETEWENLMARFMTGMGAFACFLLSGKAFLEGVWVRLLRRDFKYIDPSVDSQFQVGREA